MILLVVALLAGLGDSTVAVAFQNCVVIEDFAAAPVGQFPPSWKPRKDAGKSVYVVRDEPGRKFLQARAEKVGIQAAMEHPWDLSTQPVLAWSWRPRQFPKDSDERTDRNDSVLAVYAVFQTGRFSVKTVKYIW